MIKMSDHLVRCHREKVEVAHVLAVKLRSKNCKQAWSYSFEGRRLLT